MKLLNENYKDDKYIKKLMQDYVNVSRKPMMGSVFITQDGTFINMGDNVDDSHGDIIGMLEHEDILMYDDVWELSQDYGFVRGNSGLHLDGNAYIELLEDKPSYDQYDAIENWLYFIMNHGVKSVEVYIIEMENSITYEFDNDLPEDIIKKIKRAYSYGNLYEGWKIAQIDDEDLDDVTADVFVSDNCRDIVRDINNSSHWDQYKFILDDNKGLYIKLDPFYTIHDDAFQLVVDNYWYPELKDGNDAFAYVSEQGIKGNLHYIMVTFGVDEKGMPKDIGQDYFDFAYMYPKFNILVRKDKSFERSELYRLLGKEDKIVDISDTELFLEDVNSNVDSEGNKLSKEQLQYFKNTKVKDSKGNLLVCYHSTDDEFDEFDSEYSYDYFGFHFGTKKAAEDIGGDIIKQCYLNITNPLIIDEDLQYWDAFSFIRLIYENPQLQRDIKIDGWEDIKQHYEEDLEYGEFDESYYCAEFGEDVRQALYNSKYDGVFYTNWGEDAGSTSYMCFYPEQIKYIDNKQPTRSKKMNEGISKQQEEFFKDSKIRRRRDGSLIICTHCSDEDFETFDVDRIGSGSGGVNGYGFYFTSHETNDNGYGKNAYKCYLNITNPFIFTDDPNEIIELCEQCGYKLDQKDIDFALSEFDKYEEDYQTSIDDLLNGNVKLFTKMIKDCGYDGIWSMPYDEVIAFYPNQIKRISNQNPTNSNNINESTTIYRGEGEYNHSTHKKNYGGLFFATNEGDASEYSDNVIKYVIDDNAKIYNGRSSEIYCEQNNLFDVEDKDILELTNNTISKISQMYDDGQFIQDDYLELCFPIWQLMARKDLEKKGYDGAHWKWEDDLTPEQYQIWNTSIVSKQIGEKINEDFDMSNYMSEEYKKFQTNVHKIIERKFKVINKELDRFGFETTYVDDYDFDINEDEWVGVFYNEIQDNASVFPIAINIPFLYKEVVSGELDKDDLPYHIEKTIWHEVGHGLFEYLNDVFELDDLDEEQIVEEYACYQMGEINNSELVAILNSYVLEFSDNHQNESGVNEDYDDDELEDEDSIYAHFDEQCDQFNDAFYTLTPDEFINSVGGDKVLMDIIDENAPMYILPNGRILSVKRLFKQNGIDQTLYHANFVFPLIKNYFKDVGYSDEEIDDILCDVDDCATNIDLTDLMFHATYRWGWARCNCGRTWGENRFYCVLPNTLTTSQIYTLWDWLDWGIKNNQKNVLIFAKDTEQHTIYSMVENTSDDIIKKIKRFYASGRFYEDVNRDVEDNTINEDAISDSGEQFWYHGTTHKQLIKQFNQYVNWFSTSRKYAEEYAYALGSILYKCKLYLNNSIQCGETSHRVYSKFVNPNDYEYSKQFMDIMNQLGLDKEGIDGLVKAVIKEQAAVGDVAYQRALLIDVVTRTKIFASLCVAKGFDSIMAKEYGSHTCGVLNPSKIKIIGYKKY